MYFEISATNQRVAVSFVIDILFSYKRNWVLCVYSPHIYIFYIEHNDKAKIKSHTTHVYHNITINNNLSRVL